MRGAVLRYLINGHDVEYSRETGMRYVCLDCGAKLLSAMQFLTFECRASARRGVPSE
jgi:hypothetical protein